MLRGMVDCYIPHLARVVEIARGVVRDLEYLYEACPAGAGVNGICFCGRGVSWTRLAAEVA